MNGFYESLEGRTLFAVSPAAQVDIDLATLRADFATNAATYISTSGAINADTKALPKNKTNARDLAFLHRDVATTNATDAANSARYFAAVKLGVVRIEAAFAIESRKANLVTIEHLNAVEASVETNVAAATNRLLTAIGTGDTRDAAALNLLVSVNLTDTQFATDVDTNDTAHANGEDTIVAQLGVITSAVQTLAIDDSIE